MRLFAFKDAVRASCRLSADFFPVHIADIPVLQQAGRRGQAESIPSAVEKFDPAQISSLSSKELKQFVVSHGWSVSAGGDIVLSGKGRTHSVLQQEVLAKIAAENKKAQTAGPAITVSDAGDVFATSADLTDWSCDGWSPTRLSEVRALEISSKLAAQVLQHQAQHLQRPSRTTRWANFDVELVPRVAFQGQVIALEPCVGIMLSHTARAPPELNLAEICGSFGSKIVGLQVRSVTRGRENRGEIAGYAGRLGEGQLRDKLLSLTSCAEVRETIASSPDDEPCWQVRLGKAGKVFTFLGSKLQPCLTPKNMERLDRMLGCNASAQIGRDSILPPRERQELIDAELERLNSSAPEVTKKLFAPSPRRVADPGQCAENFVSFDEPGFLVGYAVALSQWTLSQALGEGEGRAISSVNGGALWSSLQRHGLYLYGGIGRTLCMRGYILGSSSQKDFDRSCASFHSIAQLFKQLHIEVDGSPSHVTRVASVAEALSHAEMEGAQAAVFFSRTNACYHAAKEACLQARPPGLQHLASQWIDLARPSHQAPALKNIVLQLCAKLGHTPYILQGRPEGASGGGGDDLICGMDVCHMHNPQSGEMSHVMGGIQLQQASGEVLDSWLCKGKIHGESIPDSVWEKALTKEVCSGRKVIVHRDGRFTNSEKEFLARHAASIGAAGPIGLVEIVKHAGGTPRMYTGSDNAPSGSCLIFSETECILTSGSCKSTGTRNPLLIRLVGGSTPTLSIKSVAEDIFRLSFVSYGSLYSIPRLPVSTKTADLTAYVHASLSTQALGNEANSILVSQGKQQYWL